jgi:hypothetical protein
MFLNWIRHRIQWGYDVWSIHLFIGCYEYLKGEYNLVPLLQYLNKEGTLCITRGFLIKFHWIFMSSKDLKWGGFWNWNHMQVPLLLQIKTKIVGFKSWILPNLYARSRPQTRQFLQFNPTLDSHLMPSLHS